ncbi:DUF5682 family protein, partial [Streptomyces prasinus]|uniref:DUF5682 family protein n=1 Tax=Streptomyces prasinus TaxID=67345 RepID=UPI0020102179
MSGVDRPGGGRGAGPLLLGVRHHGPGSARAVRAVLEGTGPEVVLIEGPPEANDLIPLAADEAMRPPVALLAHAVDEPGRSAFWPLAEFSPEWVAIRWALEHGTPVRFIDLPATHSLAWGRDEETDGAGRSMKRTGVPCSSAQRIATHSGENSASGQNAERPGSSTAWASRATGGRMASSAASGIRSFASGGPSIRTTSGPVPSNTARTARG